MSLGMLAIVVSVNFLSPILPRGQGRIADAEPTARNFRALKTTTGRGT